MLTTPLLEGLDGVNKMSKSLGNSVGIAEPPGEQFGKLMKIPDDLMPRYFALTTGWHPDRVDEVVGDLAIGALPAVDGEAAARPDRRRPVPRRWRGSGRRSRVRPGLQGARRADRCAPRSTSGADVFHDGRALLAKLLAEAGLAPSTREGRRLIQQGGVRVDGEVVDDPDRTLDAAAVDGRLLQVGRRRWARLRR